MKLEIVIQVFHDKQIIRSDRNKKQILRIITINILKVRVT